MSSSWWAVTIGFLVVCMAFAVCDQPEYDDKELEEAFDELEEYLEPYLDDARLELEDLDDEEIVKLVKEMETDDPKLKLAATILVYLSEFDECSPKALDYMSYALTGRQNARPGRHSLDRLDQVLEALLVQGKDTCGSFLNRWYEESEQKLDPATRRKLYKFYPSEVINEPLVRKGQFADSTVLFEAVQRDPNASKELSKLHTKEQLINFYHAYWRDNFVEPCEKFLVTMGDIMRQGGRLRLRYSYHIGEQFFDPSQSYLDSLYRYSCCKDQQLRSQTFTLAAEEAARKTLSARNV